MSELLIPNRSIVPSATNRDGYGRRGIWASILTASATVLTVASVVLGYCIIVPVRWDGLGLLGAIVLIFPLHLLLASMVDAVFAFIAKRSNAKLAAHMFVFMSVLNVVLALIPVVAIWQTAHRLNAPLSFGSYIANATHLNLGRSRTDQSVIYGTTADGIQLKLDVWRTGLPRSGAMRPAIVIVHGGAWIHGTRSMLPEWDRWFNELGYEVFDVEYRMPPQAGQQREVGDVKAALGWIVAHAEEYYVDPARITLMGNSAGGNLALLAAYSVGNTDLAPSTDVPPVSIHSVISLYGPTDLALLSRSSLSQKYVRDAMRQYVGGSVEEFPERYRLLSPVHHVGPKTPPTIIIHGTCDRLVGLDQARVLDEALRHARIEHELVLLPGSDHVFDANWGGFATQIARSRIRAFLDKRQND